MDYDALDIAGEINRDVRRHGVVKQNAVIPQGDVYLHCLSGRTNLDSIVEDRQALEARIQKVWPDFRLGTIGKVTDDLRLVTGNSLGASHRIREEDRGLVTLYAPSSDASPLEGPVLIVKGPGVILDHAEHAQHELPEGTYQVIMQRDHAFEEMQRVQD